MTLSKIVVDARERVRVHQSKLDQLTAELAAEDKAREPARKALDAHRARGMRRAIVVKTSQGVSLAKGVDVFATDFYTVKDKDSAKEAALRKGVADGSIKVTMSGGQAFSPKSIPARAHYVSPEAMRAIRSAERAVRRAQAAYNAAKAKERAALEAAFEDGDRVTVEDVAAHVARKHVLVAKIGHRYYDPRSSEIDRIKNHQLPAAQKHLAWAESRAKTPCPCSTCDMARQNARFKADMEARAKASRQQQGAA